MSGMVPGQGVRRRLNEIEYFNWCLDQPYNIVVMVRLAGRLAPDALRVALDKVQQRHPLLRANTVLDDHGDPWLDSAGVGPIPLDVRRREGDDDAGQVMDQELSQPFPMDAGGSSGACLARVVLLTPDGPDGTDSASSADMDGPSDLVISVQHVVTDGMSMLFLVRDLLGFLRDPDAAVEVLDVPASAAAILPPGAARRVARSPRPLRIALLLVRAYRRLRRIPDGAAPGDADGPVPVHSWRLTPEQTAALLARCRSEGVSVQTAVCTAFLPSHTLINSPVSLRARLAHPVGESVGLFVGTALIRARFDARQGFWSNARAFHRRFRRSLRNPFLVFRLCSPAVPREQVREFIAATTGLFDRRRPFGVTNLGSLDGRSLGLDGDGGLRVLSFDGRASGFTAASVLTVYTIGGRMHVNLRGTPAMSQEQNRVEGERAMALLLPAIG